MVKTDKLVKEIKSYNDLREVKPGELMLIGGRIELVIDPKSEHIERLGFEKKKIYTLSIEGDYYVQNHYYATLSDNSDLSPFMKSSCKKNSECALEDALYNIGKKGGLI